MASFGANTLRVSMPQRGRAITQAVSVASPSRRCYKAIGFRRRGPARGIDVDVLRSVELGFVSAGAAILGSMLGLGGGVFLVPIFTLFFAVDQKVAIGASAVAVVTNSVVGSTVHLRSRFTNLRLAMLLQVATAAGATAGAIIGVYANPRVVNAIFGVVLVYAAVSMAVRRQAAAAGPPVEDDRLRLGGMYRDPAAKDPAAQVRYAPERVPIGLGVSGMAGMLSGMLGVGGGVIQVPAMNLLMRVPVKAAAGTSSFMVGITAVATASVFYAQGKIDPTVVVPAMIGIFVGSQMGSRLTRRIQTQNLVVLFVLILLYLGGSLLLKAAGITLPGQQ